MNFFPHYSRKLYAEHRADRAAQRYVDSGRTDNRAKEWALRWMNWALNRAKVRP